MHLPRLAVLHGGDDEAGAAQDDLTPGPAVDRQLELPFADVVRPRQLDSLRALDALGLPCAHQEKEELYEAATLSVSRFRAPLQKTNVDEKSLSF